MGFENIPRPGPLNPQSDPLASNLIAHQISEALSRAEKVRPVEEGSESQNIRKDPDQKQNDGSSHDPAGQNAEKHEVLTREQREHLLAMAKNRGVLNVTSEDMQDYRMFLNPKTQWIDLISLKTGNTILSIRPEELAQVTEQTYHASGLITDELG